MTSGTQRALALILAVVAPQQANAQMFSNLAPTLAMNRLMLAPVMAQANRVANGWNETENRRASPERTPIDFAPLKYRPDEERRSSNLAAFVADSRSVDPQGAAAMERLFASTDVIGALDGGMRKIGLRADNVADAYAVWWMLAWHATQGTKAEPTTTTALAVRDQAARAMLATPEFAAADDAAKQQMAEALLIQAMLVDGMNEEYGSDPAMAAKLARAVNEGAGKMGLDLTAMELTPAGFVPRRGADAGGAAGDDAQPTALAAAARPDDSGTASAALPLAIGAVALGGVLLLGREWGRRG